MAKKPKQTPSQVFWSPITKPFSKSLKKRGITASKKRNDASIGSYVALIIFAGVLPLFGWYLGAHSNPHGWMSDSPTVAYTYLFYLSIYLWPVTVAIPILYVSAVLTLKATGVFWFKLLSVLIFVISLVSSSFVMMAVGNADSSEFNG